MRQEQLLRVIRAPHLSEKGTLLAEKGQYVFKVASWATKTDIGAAVKYLFNVDATAVRTCTVKGKRKRDKRFALSTRPTWKKAYVSLKAGQVIKMGAEA